MTYMNLTPKFKYSTLLCCQFEDIFIIYRPTRDISVNENHQHVQGWNPTTRRIKTKIKIWDLIVLFKNKKEQLNKDNDKHALLKRGTWLVCCQHHSPRTSYHATSDWLVRDQISSLEYRPNSYRKPISLSTISLNLT